MHVVCKRVFGRCVEIFYILLFVSFFFVVFSILSVGILVDGLRYHRVVRCGSECFCFHLGRWRGWLPGDDFPENGLLTSERTKTLKSQSELAMLGKTSAFFPFAVFFFCPPRMFVHIAWTTYRSFWVRSSPHPKLVVFLFLRRVFLSFEKFILSVSLFFRFPVAFAFSSRFLMLFSSGCIWPKAALFAYPIDGCLVAGHRLEIGTSIILISSFAGSFFPLYLVVQFSTAMRDMMSVHRIRFFLLTFSPPTFWMTWQC